MHAEISDRRDALIALSRRYGVTRLEIFGSAARGDDFDFGRSDADFLVTFPAESRNDLMVSSTSSVIWRRLLGRPVELVEREAVEKSRNFIRRRLILAEAEPVYG